jgi:hypothetical protein
MFKDLILLEKTDITVKTPYGEVTLAIAKRDTGYACGLWSGDNLLKSAVIPLDTGMLGKVNIIGPLLIKAKDHLSASAERFPTGIELLVRVEHKGSVHEIPGRIPLSEPQLSQLMNLVEVIRQANAKVGGA